MVLTYAGVVGTSFNVMDKETNDSLFSAGWLI